MTRRNAQGGRTSWLARLVVWLMLVSVHTASFAQVVRPIIWGPHGAPQTGFAANGTFLQNGIITPNPHQGLHTLMNISVWTLSAFALSNTSDPNYVQPSLADMATALNLTPQQAASQINTLYVGANPYASVNPPNANTTANMAAYDQILADYAALGGVAATTQGQGGLSIFGSDALLNTPVFQAALPSGQGAAGVVISESIESVQNTAAVANFNAIQLQNSALLGSPIFYSKHRIPTGPGAGVGNPNCLALGECAADGAQQLHQNLFGAFNPHSGVELGYVIPGGQAHAFDLKKNPHFATSFMGAGGNETGDINPRSNSILAQNLAKATSQHIKGQQVASGINFSAFEEDRALFMQGVDLYAHVNSPAERATLDALKRGTLKPGDAGYEAAQALAQRSFSRAWAQHVEYDSAIVHNRESAHYQGQKLQLQGAGDRDLFQQGLNLYCKSCDAEQEEGLRKLAQGQLKEGDAGYQQARDLAEQRFKLAYENSLMPPPKKSLFKQLVAVVVAAVAAFFIGPAVAGWLSGVIPGATATSAAGATVVAGTSGTTLTVGGALASGIGSAVATTTSAFLSTGIATGSVSQGLKAAGQALKGGLVTAAVGMVAPALGYTDTASLANRSFSVVAQATGATAAGGGSFGQNLLSAGLNAGLAEVTAQAAGTMGQANASGNLGALGTELAHAAVGCASGAARGAISGSGKGGCASGATGAIVAHAGAGWIDAATGYTLKDSEVGFYGSLLGGTAAALVGGKDQVGQNFGSGQTTGQNAVDNNYLSTRDITAAKAQLAGCTQGCEAIARVLGADQSQGGAQIPVSRVQDLCKANPQGCAARVQDMAQAMQELQDSATRAALGPQVADRLLQRQAADLGRAVESLQWGVEHEASSRRIAQTAMAVGATALGGGVMLSVGRALVAACASGIGSPSCVAASTELAIGAMETAGGVPTTGVTAAAANGAAGKLAAAAAQGKDAQAVLREVRGLQAEVRAGANAGVVNLAETQATLTTQVADLRATLTGSAKTSGNMGVAQIDIPGIQPTMAASSRIGLPSAEQRALGFVGEVPETFPSSVVPTASTPPQLLNRAVDSEAKILNNIAAQLGDNTSATGTINLLTERAPCASCSNVIDLFKAKYPNITINVMDNGGVIRPTKKGP